MADEALLTSEALIPYAKNKNTHRLFTLFNKHKFSSLPLNLRPIFGLAGHLTSSASVNIREPNSLRWLSHLFVCSNLGFLFVCGEDSIAYYKELMKVKRTSTALKKLQQIFGEENVIQANEYRFKFFGVSSGEPAYISKDKGSKILCVDL